MKGSLSCYRFLSRSILSRPVFPRLGHALLLIPEPTAVGEKKERMRRRGRKDCSPGRHRSAHRVNVCSVLRASSSSSDDRDHKEIMDETWHGSKHGRILFRGECGGVCGGWRESEECCAWVVAQKSEDCHFFFIPENERRRNNVEQDVVGHRRRLQSPEPRRRQNSGHLLEIPTLRSVAAF